MWRGVAGGRTVRAHQRACPLKGGPPTSRLMGARAPRRRTSPRRPPLRLDRGREDPVEVLRMRNTFVRVPWGTAGRQLSLQERVQEWETTQNVQKCAVHSG